MGSPTCHRYHGSDLTYCAAHHGRFTDTGATRCDRADACRVMGASPHDRDQGALCLTHDRRLRECPPGGES